MSKLRPGNISLEVDKASLKQIDKMLKKLGGDAPKALQKAVNATARDTKTKLADKAQQAYVVKKGGFKKAIKQKNASLSDMTATLMVTGRHVSLKDFQSRKNNRKVGVRAHVKTNTALKELVSTVGGKAFLVNGKFIAQRTSSKRLPIQKLFGLSDPEMIGSEKEVYGVLKPVINEMLLNEVQKQVDRIMAGK